ncbi:MAG: TonB-dependent receptor [Steroidobacteraceae bacterium]
MRVAKSTLIGTAVAVALFGANAFAQQSTTTEDGSSSTQSSPAPALHEIVVTGIRYSVKQSLALKRIATNMTEVATATDIGKLPDKNVADVLMRLPGVDTQSSAFGEGGFGENDRVSLRGTPASLTLTTIDGHSVASADWFIEDQYQDVGRSVSYQLMPAEIVSKTVVNFGQSANLLEGGVAGSVDIQTRHPLDFKPGVTGFVNAGAAYTTLAAKASPQADAMLAWNNGIVGVLALGFYEKRTVRRDGQEFLGYAQIPASVAVGTPAVPGWTMQNPNLPNATGAYYPTLIGEALFTQTLKRQGGMIDLQARPSDELSLDLTAFYSDLQAANDNNNFLYWGSRQFGSPSYVPTSLTIQNNYVTAATFPTAAGAPPSAVYDQIYRPGAEAKTSFVNLDGKLTPNERLTVDGQLGFTYALGNSPSQPAYEYYGGNGSSYQMHGDGSVTSINFYNLSASGTQIPLVTNSPAGYGISWAWNDVVHTIDKETYGKLDATLKVDSGPFEAVKFGARFAHHQRETGFNQDQGLNCFAVTCQPAYAGGQYPSNYQSGIPGGGAWANNIFQNSEAAIAAFDSPTNLSHGPSRYYWQGSFNVTENDLSGYAMAEVGGHRWSGNFGVRVVNTLEEVTANVGGGTNPLTFSAFGPFTPTEMDNRYLNILPSANFKFDLSKRMLLRFSAAETMSLPDYSTLGGAVILTDTNLTGSGGNPNLKPIKGAVYSSDLEYYYGPESMVEGGLFYMDLSSYVDFGNRQQTYLNMTATGNGPAVYSSYTITSAFNEPAQIKGAFASWQQALPLGFGVNANFTLADGTTQNGDPVQGDSKYTWNLGGYYQHGPINANLDYTYRSHYYVASYEGTQEYQDNWANLDAAVTWTVLHNLSLNFNAQNLTNENIRYYANGNPGAPFAIYDNGRTFYLTAQYKF